MKRLCAECKPILLAFDLGREEVISDAFPPLTGNDFDILQKLRLPYLSDRSRSKLPANYAFTLAKDLAEMLFVKPASLRKGLDRLRSRLSKAGLDRQDVVETWPWRGYRLNPIRVIVVASEELRRAIEQNDTARQAARGMQ